MNNEHVRAMAENFENLTATLIALGVDYGRVDATAVAILYSDDAKWDTSAPSGVGPMLGRDVTGGVHLVMHGDDWPVSWAPLAAFI